MREHLKDSFVKTKLWILEHKKLSICIGVVLVLVFIAIGFLIFKNRDNTQRLSTEAKTEEVKKPVLVPSPLTGVQVTDQIANEPVIGVMIENSPDARPQSGLHEAGVVFEAIAEGGITRFIAFYQEDNPASIGPVRSLRPYYLDWAHTFNANVAHVGGSTEALHRAKGELGSRDLDQFRYGSSLFDRVKFRHAPHNVYTSMERLKNKAKELGNSKSSFTPIKRKAAAASASPTATNINVNFSSGLYKVGWTYDQATNKYLRSNGGSVHTDKDTGQQITADVVVVVKTAYRTSTSVGHQAVNTTGSGDVYIFQDGVATAGTWSKSANNGQFIFKDTAGVEVGLNPGRTWFAIIPTTQSVSY